MTAISLVSIIRRFLTIFLLYHANFRSRLHASSPANSLSYKYTCGFGCLSVQIVSVSKNKFILHDGNLRILFSKI